MSTTGWQDQRVCGLGYHYTIAIVREAFADVMGHELLPRITRITNEPDRIEARLARCDWSEMPPRFSAKKPPTVFQILVLDQ